MLTRRRLIGTSVALAAVALAGAPVQAASDPEADEVDYETARQNLLGDQAAIPGGIAITLPSVAGSGNSVPLTISVEADPAAGPVRLHVFAPRNPRPHVCSVTLGPRAGKTEFSTKIRLNGTQELIAFAELPGGVLRTASKTIDVTIGACESLEFNP